MLERSNHHQLILDKQKQVNDLNNEIAELRDKSMEGYELPTIQDLLNEIHAQWAERS
jgi:hypothetical protein